MNQNYLLAKVIQRISNLSIATEENLNSAREKIEALEKQLQHLVLAARERE